MPRPRNLEPSIPLKLKLPESVRVRLDLHLFSPLEGRVPQGRYQEFFIDRIKEFFDWKRLDLAPFGFGIGYYIAGPREMIEALERRLKG